MCDGYYLSAHIHGFFGGFHCLGGIAAKGAGNDNTFFAHARRSGMYKFIGRVQTGPQLFCIAL